MITAIDRNKPVTVVAFSGLAPKNTVFEWVKTFSALDCNFVGVKDPANDWYQSKKDAIAWEVSSAAPWEKKRLFIGASAGGFAALMFGKLLVADAVLAISPQSACGKAKRDLGDNRWPEFCDDDVPSCDIAGGHDAIIHYALDDALDTMHAERLVCRRWEHPTGGHNLVGVLKESGMLGDVIANELKRIA